MRNVAKARQVSTEGREHSGGKDRRRRGGMRAVSFPALCVTSTFLERKIKCVCFPFFLSSSIPPRQAIPALLLRTPSLKRKPERNKIQAPSSPPRLLETPVCKINIAGECLPWSCGQTSTYQDPSFPAPLLEPPGCKITINEDSQKKLPSHYLKMAP